jgi:hypothetical protein
MGDRQYALLKIETSYKVYMEANISVFEEAFSSAMAGCTRGCYRSGGLHDSCNDPQIQFRLFYMERIHMFDATYSWM